MSDRWINVKDQLPEQGQYVLCAKVGDVFTDFYFFKDGFFHPFSYPKPEQSVTHWQPIPSPPKSKTNVNLINQNNL